MQVIALGSAVVAVAAAAVAVVIVIWVHPQHFSAAWGTVPDALAAFGTLCAVIVALWQSTVVRRQTQAEGIDAAKRLQNELAAANERTGREVAAAEERSRRELEAAEARHRAEIENQQQLARIQRVHLSEQQQKQALIEISRAVNAHTHMLATLWVEGAKILKLEERADRQLAFHTVSEQLGRCVHNSALEIENARMLVEDERLIEAIEGIRDATEKAVFVGDLVRISVTEGTPPPASLIPDAQALLQQASAQARELAVEILRTGFA